MRVAIDCAGFTPGEADQLRRATQPPSRSAAGSARFARSWSAAWWRAAMRPPSPSAPSHSWRGSAPTAFRSHAASFALIAYASSWLKRHHPDVFCAALLNAQPMGFYAPAQIVRDACGHGVEVRPVCVNASRWDYTLEPTQTPGRLAVRLGLRMVRGLANAQAAAIVSPRRPALRQP